LWALAASPDVARSLEVAAQDDEVSKAPFTTAQQTEVTSRIEAIKSEVREKFELTAEQYSGIDQKLDDLVDASTRVGPQDWRVMLYGAAFGMIVNDSVPPGVVQSIIGMVVHGLGHILGIGAPPPGLPPQT
jgi:hypothetical protein